MHHYTPVVILTLAALAICITPPTLLLLLGIALAVAMQPVRVAWWTARRVGNVLNRRPTVDWCSCDHQAAEHLHGTGRCRGEDADGQRCACTTFEPEPDLGPDC